MPEPTCGGSVQACAMRVTMLEQDGVPLPGPIHTYTLATVSKLEAVPVYVKGVDLEVLSACNAPSLLYKDMDRMKRFDLTLTMIHYDPEFDNLLLGTELFNTGGQNVGISAPATAAYAGYFPGVSLEIWSKHITNGDIDPQWPYIQWVLPRTRWQRGNITWDNAAMPVSFTGYTTQNPNYEDGPFDDWPFASDTALMSRYTTTLPTPTCGASTFVGS